MAKMKPLIASLDEVDEGLRDFYTKTETGFVLDVDGDTYKGKLDEFRKENITTRKQREELEAKLKAFEGVDPEAYRKLLELQAKMEGEQDAELLKAGKFDEVLKKRTQTMEQDFTNKLKAAQRNEQAANEKLAALMDRFESLAIRTSVIEQVTKAGTPVQGALDDIINRGRTVFGVDENGEIVNKSWNNKKGEKGTLEEWALDLIDRAPFLFESPKSGASRGSQSRAGPNGIKIIKNDPRLINQYRKEIQEGKVQVEGFTSSDTATL